MNDSHAGMGDSDAGPGDSDATQMPVWATRMRVWVTRKLAWPGAEAMLVWATRMLRCWSGSSGLGHAMGMVRFNHACLHDSDAGLNAVQVSRGAAWNPALAAQRDGSSQLSLPLLLGFFLHWCKGALQ